MKPANPKDIAVENAKRALKRSNIDHKALRKIRSGPAKSFFVTCVRPSVKKGFGICLASELWQNFAGMNDEDFLGKDPIELLRGPFTSEDHIGPTLRTSVIIEQTTSLDHSSLPSITRLGDHQPKISSSYSWSGPHLLLLLELTVADHHRCHLRTA